MQQMSCRSLVLAIALVLLAAPVQTPQGSQSSQAPAFELDEATVSGLQEAMASGRTSARRLVDLYTERIKAIDRSGPALHAVIEMNPDAPGIADALDGERRTGHVRGPLHGIP